MYPSIHLSTVSIHIYIYNIYPSIHPSVHPSIYRPAWYVLDTRDTLRFPTTLEVVLHVLWVSWWTLGRRVDLFFVMGIWRFPTMGVPPKCINMDGLSWNILWKWMIWGYFLDLGNLQQLWSWWVVTRDAGHFQPLFGWLLQQGRNIRNTKQLRILDGSGAWNVTFFVPSHSFFCDWPGVSKALILFSLLFTQSFKVNSSLRLQQCARLWFFRRAYRRDP